MKKGTTTTLRFTFKDISLADVASIDFFFNDEREGKQDKEPVLTKVFPHDAYMREEVIFLPLKQEETACLPNTFYIEAQINFKDKSSTKAFTKKYEMEPTIHTHFLDENESSGNEEIINVDFKIDEAIMLGFDYNESINKPKINDNELIGNKTGAELDLQDKLIAGVNITIAADGKTISAKNGGKFIIVEELPEEDIDLTAIYLLPKKDEEESNIYDEYIYIDSIDKWEKIGSTEINLDDYYTKDEVDNKFENMGDIEFNHTGLVETTISHDCNEWYIEVPETYPTTYNKKYSKGIRRTDVIDNKIIVEYDSKVENMPPYLGYGYGTDENTFVSKTGPGNQVKYYTNYCEIDITNYGSEQNPYIFIVLSNYNGSTSTVYDYFENPVIKYNTYAEEQVKKTINKDYYLADEIDKTFATKKALNDTKDEIDNVLDTKQDIMSATGHMSINNNVITTEANKIYTAVMKNGSISTDLTDYPNLDRNDLAVGKGINEVGQSYIKIWYIHPYASSRIAGWTPVKYNTNQVYIQTTDPEGSSSGQAKYTIGDIWVKNASEVWILVNRTLVPSSAPPVYLYTWSKLTPDLSNYYTKTQIDNLLSSKQDTIDSTHKLSADNVDDSTSTNKFVTSTEKSTWNDKVGNTDYATSSVAGVLKSDSNWFKVSSQNGAPVCDVKTYQQYLDVSSNNVFISKGTLENVISGKGLVDSTDLATKQDKTDITTDTTSTTVSLTLADNHEYRYTQDLTSLTLTMPSGDFISSIVFASGSTPTSMTYDSSIKWSGDDITNGQFVPQASKDYDIMFYYNGLNINGIVRGVS